MPRIAVILALVSIVLWSFVALLTSNLAGVPLFFLVGFTLIVGSLTGMYRLRQWFVPWKTLLVGLLGYFVYHLLLFSAYQSAPPVETSLINYLWPLLIVLLTPLFLPGQSLRPYHIIAALMGLIGAGLIATRGRFELDLHNLPGYLMALGAAFTWAAYSLLTKRVPPFSSAAVSGFCLISGVMALVIFFLQSGAFQAVQNLRGSQWILLIIMGIGPNGLAFQTWDAAIKHGDPRLIGSLSYLTPLLSTINLALIGRQPFTWVAAIAMLLIVAGAVLGSSAMWTNNKNRTS
jgi:drug/metabolite transporter (DMT)-like permease